MHSTWSKYHSKAFYAMHKGVRTCDLPNLEDRDTVRKGLSLKVYLALPTITVQAVVRGETRRVPMKSHTTLPSRSVR
jgi:hypothetical protein